MFLLVASSSAITSYLNEQEQSRLKDVLLGGLTSDDIGILDHSVRGLALTGTQIPNKDKLCQKLSGKLSDQKPESLFHVAKAASAIGCNLQFPTDIKGKLDGIISSSTSVSELFFSVGTLSTLGHGLDAAKVLKTLNAALKKDDSISSLGQAFHIASQLQGDVSSVFGRIEDAIVQADLVKKMDK